MAGAEPHCIGDGCWGILIEQCCPTILSEPGSAVAEGIWKAKKVIEIPAEPADSDLLPPVLKGFKACPPFVTDIDLSVDDKYLYASCWGTGDFHQYDVSDPLNPKLTGKLRIGGVVSKAPHPSATGPLTGAPQMVEISRDGRRIYCTSSLYGAIDAQVYPDGIEGWMVKVNAEPNGGIEFDPEFSSTGRRACCRIRCAFRAATPLRIPIVTPDTAPHSVVEPQC